MTKFTYISLFAGIGGFDFGLNEVGGECVFASEIDKYAQESYKALHGAEVLHGDITLIDAKDIPDHDVIAAGFPCQAFSVAGKRGGFEDARGTLFFEVARIAKEKRPKVLLLENVKGLVGHNGGTTLDTIVKTLSDIGYRTDFQVLNSKYFGVPQNRERVFIIAIREDLVAQEEWTNVTGATVVPKGKRRLMTYDDIKTFNFDYPTNDTVEFRLSDVLEESVEEKFYLSEEKTQYLLANLRNRPLKETGVNKIAGLYGDSQAGSVFDPRGVSPTVDTAGGGNREPIITEQKGVIINRNELGGETDLSHTLMARDYKGLGNQDMAGVIVGAASRTRENGKQLELNGYEESNALTTVQHDSLAVETNPIRIRRLTPKECFRLQGFTDAQHDAVEAAGISVSQRYKQAGNAVTVNVIVALGERLLPYL